MTILISAATATFDILIFMLSKQIVKWERHDTKTSEAESLFSKLSQAYLVNSVLVPIGVGLYLSGGIDHTWYESGGPVSTAMVLMLFNYITPLLKAINPGPIINRFIFGRCAYSQLKVRMAYTLKTTALGLVYGPIYPMAYVLTAIGLSFSWLMTRCGMHYWYAMPADVHQDMMMVFRYRLGHIIGLSVMLQAWATAEAMGSDGGFHSGGVVVVGGPILVVLYALIPLGFLKKFAKFDELAGATSSAGPSLDTKGIAFDDVDKITGQLAHLYFCPVLRKSGDDIVMVRARVGRIVVDSQVNALEGERLSKKEKEEESQLLSGVSNVKPEDMKYLTIDKPGAIASRILSELGYATAAASTRGDDERPARAVAAVAAIDCSTISCTTASTDTAPSAVETEVAAEAEAAAELWAEEAAESVAAAPQLPVPTSEALAQGSMEYAPPYAPVDTTGDGQDDTVYIDTTGDDHLDRAV